MLRNKTVSIVPVKGLNMGLEIVMDERLEGIDYCVKIN